ncbi:SRSO17 transposase [Streptomyces sp. V4I2]|nr:SRSO17 transposase [Streptomyces sp. V4I2]
MTGQPSGEEKHFWGFPRIPINYRELKHGLGLDHFEGRSWNGWHHHATLVTAAHAFLTEQRLHPKADTPNVRSLMPRSWATSATFLPDAMRPRTLRRNSGG